MRRLQTHFVSAVASVMLLAGTATACTATLQPRAGIVYVRTAPPERIVEVRTVSPGRDYVWINGYHEYRGNAYVWVPGRWDRPLDNHRRWADGQWKHDRNGWYWIPGHWR
jgi:hypothetical protein